MMKCWIVVIAFLMVWVPIAHAVDIQYLLSNGNVTGVSDTPISEVPDHGVVHVIGTASQIVWPVPAGCSAGRREWTRITNPGGVTLAGGGMAVRVGLVWFTTTSPLLPGCHLVSRWAQLKALVEDTVIKAVQANDLVLTLNDLNTIVQVRCPGATGGATCDSVRASMATLNSSYPSAATLNGFLSQIVTLRADALAMKTAQGW